MPQTRRRSPAPVDPEQQPNPDRLTGKIARLMSARGFGFLKAENGEEYFFHRSDLVSGGPFDTLQDGWKVQFLPVSGTGKGNNLRAEQVSVQRP